MTTITIVTVPIDIVWPLGLIHFHAKVYAVVGVSQLIPMICIVAANSFLKYKITLANRKAAENQRLGNEEVKSLKTFWKRFEHRPKLPSHYS